MRIKKVLKCMAGAAALLGLYLATVAIWASLSVADLLPEASVHRGQPALTQQQTAMLLKIEDPTFFEHPGLDISQGQGLTTLTSSLARSIFLSGRTLDGARGGFQSFYRAVFDCCKKVDVGRDVMALVLDRHVSKDRQIELFVATVYMGRHDRKAVVGLPAAADAYFGKALPDLSTDEFLTLVAMIKSPNLYHPVTGAALLEQRASRMAGILAGTCTPDGWFDTDYEACDD